MNNHWRQGALVSLGVGVGIGIGVETGMRINPVTKLPIDDNEDDNEETKLETSACCKSPVISINYRYTDTVELFEKTNLFIEKRRRCHGNVSRFQRQRTERAGQIQA